MKTRRRSRKAAASSRLNLIAKYMECHSQGMSVDEALVELGMRKSQLYYFRHVIRTKNHLPLPNFAGERGGCKPSRASVAKQIVSDERRDEELCFVLVAG